MMNWIVVTRGRGRGDGIAIAISYVVNGDSFFYNGLIIVSRSDGLSVTVVKSKIHKSH